MKAPTSKERKALTMLAYVFLFGIFIGQSPETPRFVKSAVILIFTVWVIVILVIRVADTLTGRKLKSK